MGARTGCNLVQVFQRVLEHFGLTERLLTITTDNAFNNSRIWKTLQQALFGNHNVVRDVEVT